MSHGHGMSIANASLVWHGKHSSVVQEILESNHRLQDGPEIIRGREAQAPDFTNRIDIESYATFPELEPGHLAASQAPDEPLVHFSQRYLRRPNPVCRSLHALRFENEEKDFGFLGAEAQRECVPSMVC